MKLLFFDSNLLWLLVIMTTCYYVLDNNTRMYSYHEIDGVGYGCIDIVYHTWDAEDCKRGLIDHDGYDANILVVSAESLS
jgi:hypothetical protein